ncbi:hypothetical protein [Enterovibrio sp. 27052020O]|uniref:hypothetical protein n=1 Tax=Enterovibrio sp. 27052020O TaxID=3241166 RepID=UPI00388F2152
MFKRTLIATAIIGFASMSGFAAAAAQAQSVPIYRCVVDNNNNDSTYVPAYVCRNMGGKVIY